MQISSFHKFFPWFDFRTRRLLMRTTGTVKTIKDALFPRAKWSLNFSCFFHFRLLVLISRWAVIASCASAFSRQRLKICADCSGKCKAFEKLIALKWKLALERRKNRVSTHTHGNLIGGCNTALTFHLKGEKMYTVTTFIFVYHVPLLDDKALHFMDYILLFISFLFW